MHIFNVVYYRGSGLWKWLLYTVVPSALPIAISTITALNNVPMSSRLGDYINTNDLIFMGLSVNVANLNVWATKITVSMKHLVTAMSIACLFVLTICLTLSYTSEGISTAVATIARLFVLLSIATSLKTTLALMSHSKRKLKTQSK